MFCPKCGTNQSDELRFCKNCGSTLQAVRLSVDAREEGEKFDWGKTWVAEMFLSEAERKKRLQELERLSGITPEVKRYNEIKGGVITSCVGIALMINGIFVSKKQVEAARRSLPSPPEALGRGTQAHALRPADTSEFANRGFSGAEGTTQHPAPPAAKLQDPDNT